MFREKDFYFGRGSENEEHEHVESYSEDTKTEEHGLLPVDEHVVITGAGQLPSVKQYQQNITPNDTSKSQTIASILTKSKPIKQYSDSKYWVNEPYWQGGVTRGASRRRSSIIAPERPQHYFPVMKDREEVVVESSRVGRRAMLKRRSIDITSLIHDPKLNKQRKERDGKKASTIKLHQQSISGPRSIDDLVTKRAGALNEADTTGTSNDDFYSRLGELQRTTTAPKTIKLQFSNDGNQKIIIEDSNRQERKYLIKGRRIMTTTATGSDRLQTDNPVCDTKNNAFNMSDTTSQPDPSLVAQISEQDRGQVFDTLKSSTHLPTKDDTSPSHAYDKTWPEHSIEITPPRRDIYMPPFPSRRGSICPADGSNSSNGIGRSRINNNTLYDREIESECDPNNKHGKLGLRDRLWRSYRRSLKRNRPTITTGASNSSVKQMTFRDWFQARMCNDPMELWNEDNFDSGSDSEEDVPESAIEEGDNNNLWRDPQVKNESSSVNSEVSSQKVDPSPPDKLTYWYCCGCSNGPNLIGLYIHCSECYHMRCYSCTDEILWTRKNDDDRMSHSSSPTSIFSFEERIPSIDTQYSAAESASSNTQYSTGEPASTNTQYSTGEYDFSDDDLSIEISSTNPEYSVAEILSARRELVNFFCKNEHFIPLYKEAIRSKIIGPDRFARNFRMVLKIYSKELMDQAEDRLHYDIARLVRFGAKHVSEAIKRKYASAVKSSFDEEDQNTFREDDVSKLTLVEDFLTKGPAFANLRMNLENSIRPTLPSQQITIAQPLPEENLPETKAPMVKPEISREKLQVAASVEGTWGRCVFAGIQQLSARVGLAEKPIEHGKQRLRWRCSCGKRLFDDYKELEPGSLAELHKFMEESSRVTTKDGNSQAGNSSSDKGHLSNMGASIRSCLNGKFATPHRDSYLPSHNPQQVANATTTNNTNPKPLPSTHLMLCMSSSRFGVNLYQEDVSSLQTDRELFPYLRRAYTLRRGWIRSFFSLRTVESIDFVKFDLFTGESVDLQHHDKYCRPTACECLPPKPLTEEPNPEYRCTPVPPPYSPPIGPNLLMHYLQHPDCISAKQTRVIRQFPKRMRGQLAPLDDDAVHGWGIHFCEGWAWDKIWAALMIVFVLGSVIFAILWSVLQRDLQGAFGVASWWVSICTVCLGYMATRNP